MDTSNSFQRRSSVVFQSIAGSKTEGLAYLAGHDPMGLTRRMTSRRRPFFLRIVFLEFILALVGLFTVLSYVFGISSHSTPIPSWSGWTTSRKLKGMGERSLFMTEKECRKEYPLLYAPIDEAVGRGGFPFSRDQDNYTGLVQARIQNNQLYVISSSNTTNNNVNVKHRLAALHQIHKAVITSTEPLPDTVFAFTPTDQPKNNSWSYSKWYDHHDFLNHWPVPHFGHWSWPVKYVGGMSEVAQQVEEIESHLNFNDKVDKMFWRGSTVFNSIFNGNLRGNLLGASEGKPWADVDTLQWTTLEHAKNIIQIPEICKYKYIAYTEGITYSGRLPFHMLCESVIITTPINYMMHSTHLMKPMFAWEMGFSSTKHQGEYALKRMRKAWPRGYNPKEANVVFVSPDWSDLEETVLWLQANPSITKGIAQRQKDLTVRKGYLSESAEMCYWRETIRGWNKVAVPTGKGWDELGMKWESYVLTGKTIWD